MSGLMILGDYYPIAFKQVNPGGHDAPNTLSWFAVNLVGFAINVQFCLRSEKIQMNMPNVSAITNDLIVP